MEFCLEQVDLLEHILGAEQEALKQVEYIKNTIGYEIELEIDYKELEQTKYEFEKNNIKIVKMEYNEKIKLCVQIAENKLDTLDKLNLKSENSTKKYVEM